MVASSSPQFIVDDSNPLISFNDLKNWERGGVPGEYNGTETGTQTIGSTAQLTFNGMAEPFQ